MNQWHPGWDPYPPIPANEHTHLTTKSGAVACGDFFGASTVHADKVSCPSCLAVLRGEPQPDPGDYRAETPGPYTSPPSNPIPAPKPPRYGWGTLVTVGVLVGLFIVGLAVSASRDDTEVQIPNTVLHPTPTPTPSHFTPQAHKPGPPVSGVEEYMPDDGQYLVGVQIQPGTYSAVCAEEFCSWVRCEYIPELGIEFGVADNYSSTAPRDRRVVGQTEIVKILKTDSSFITQGFTSWVRS